MSEINPLASHALADSALAHGAPAKPTQPHLAQLVQLSAEGRRRNAAWPHRPDRPLDPYEMVLLAQHEWRVGRVMHANALIEEAFLTYDAIAARRG